ncbi:LysE family translocator [Stackebrandtia nassauensis]|uniref:Lysine exporter protein (LYSE/YGGA) n=1 Tax=Stackebrandtia nassauensis (strain DSM 44728 / CIP 108903 / NRRL B-16338 / NBRC 102104 / LLR-40K-21) TaxID=446470 RepID=D3Q3Y4_STANL|nr:LysE family translocator [Stackebrandtia nassauensis]ADD44051.1 Lysine exporter protein (LYSE/YGGA) [Stackebrandtia nassauensis DSM 44728]
MVSLGAIAGVAAIALGMVLTPGPNMFYLVSRTLNQNRRAGLVSLTGMAAGFVIYLLATIAGLTAVFALVPAAFFVLKIAGAAYLLYLAWQAFRPGGASPFSPEPSPAQSYTRLFTMGMVTNLLNPKIAIFYVSLLPQFVDPHAGNLVGQSLALGLTQVAIALTVNGLIVVCASGLAGFLKRRPTWMRAQRAVMGTVLAAFAVRMAFDPTRASATP